MVNDPTIQRYRNWYAKLLGLYSKPFCECFAEGMEQTFSDLLRERRHSKKGLFTFAVWVFGETFAQIIRERWTLMTKQNKNILRIALVTAFLLMIPAVAMQFPKTGVVWGPLDFIVAGALLFGSGLAFELLSRRMNNLSYRVAVALAVLTALMVVWSNLAVGIIGDEGDPVNLLFFGVIAVGAIGAIWARFQPRGMSRALFVTAGAQLLVPVLALIVWKIPANSNFVREFVLNGVFVLLFASSAYLFLRAGSSNPTRPAV